MPRVPGRPRIFISYTGRDQLGPALANALLTGLEQDFEAFVDRVRIDAGAAWDQRIANQLNSCSAAVILLTRAALTDTIWVRHESEILVNRWLAAQDNNRSFPIVPLLFDGVTPADIAAEAAWNTVQLGRLNLLPRLTPTNLAYSTAELAEVVSLVLEDLRGKCGSWSPLLRVPGDQFWAAQAVTTLSSSSAALRSSLGLAPDVAEEVLVDELLRELLAAIQALPVELGAKGGRPANRRGMNGAAARVAELGTGVFDKAQVESLFKNLEPFLAHPGSAEAFRSILGDPANSGKVTQRIVELSLLSDYSVRLHVRRAFIPAAGAPDNVIFLNNTGSQQDFVDNSLAQLQRIQDDLEILGDEPAPVVFWLQGPLHATTRVQLLQEAAKFRISVAWLVFGDVIGAGNAEQLTTAYDAPNSELELLRDACAREKRLTVPWGAGDWVGGCDVFETFKAKLEKRQ